MGPIDFMPYPKDYSDFFVADLEAYIKRHQHDLAGIIIEPMLGEGGYIPANPEVLIALDRLCKQYKVYLILDEVQTGIGRTGRWFAFQHYNLDPDIITLAKGIGSGMPIGAMAAKASIMDQWKTGAHGGTYCGNPVCAQAALATLSIVERLLPRISTVADSAVQYLKSRLDSHPHIAEIRHLGLMIGISCVFDKSAYKPYPMWVKKLLPAILDQNILVIACNGHVLRIMPPLIIRADQLLDALSVVCDVIDTYR